MLILIQFWPLALLEILENIVELLELKILYSILPSDTQIKKCHENSTDQSVWRLKSIIWSSDTGYDRTGYESHAPLNSIMS